MQAVSKIGTLQWGIGISSSKIAFRIVPCLHKFVLVFILQFFYLLLWWCLKAFKYWLRIRSPTFVSIPQYTKSSLLKHWIGAYLLVFMAFALLIHIFLGKNLQAFFSCSFLFFVGSFSRLSTRAISELSIILFDHLRCFLGWVDSYCYSLKG
jgi:hypothetical protein